MQFVNQEIYPGEFALHKKYAQSELLLDLVWTHCNIVAEIALSFLDSGTFDTTETPRDVTTQAALLHDIGVYQCGGFEWMPNQPPSEKPYIQHTVVGAWILQQEGYSPAVIQSAYVHTGVGLTTQDISMYQLNLPPDDYVPRTMLQKLICYASKFHSKTPKFRSADDVVQSLAKYGEEKLKTFSEFQQLFGEPNLEPIQKRYENWHKGFEYQLSQLTNSQIPQSVSPSPLNPAGISTSH